MIRKNASKVLALLALTTLGLASCNGGGTEGSSVTSSSESGEQVSKAVFNMLNASYLTLSTNGILMGKTFALTPSIAAYPDVAVDYSIDQTKTTFKNVAKEYSLNAQSLLSISDDGTTLVASKEGELDENSPYGALTATISIGDETFTRDYLVMVTQPNYTSIYDLINGGASSGDIVTVRGIYTGRNTVETAQYHSYESAYIADGEYGMQLYQFDTYAFPEGLVEGETLVEVTGVYSPYNGLPEIKYDENQGSEIKIVDAADDDGTVKDPVTIYLNENNTEVTTDDLNRRVNITGGVITSYSTDSYGSQTVGWKLGDVEMPPVYVDNRYSSLEIFKDVPAGYVFSGDFFVSADSNLNLQFEYPQDNVVVSASTVDEVSVSLSLSTDTIYYGYEVGNTAQATATVSLPAGVSDSSVSYSSSNTDVATISTDGKITAVGAGTTTIAATSTADSTKKAEKTLTVVAAPQPATTIKAAKETLKNNHTSADGSDTLMAVTGKITSIANSSYGNLYINESDGTGVYVYGTENFDSNSFKEGDIVTVFGNANLDKSYGLEFKDVYMFKPNGASSYDVSPKEYTTAAAVNALTFLDCGDYAEIKGVTSIDLPTDSRATLHLSDGTVATNVYDDDDAFKSLPTLNDNQTYTIKCYISNFKGTVQIQNIVSIEAA